MVGSAAAGQLLGRSLDEPRRHQLVELLGNRRPGHAGVLNQVGRPSEEDSRLEV